MHVTLSLDRGEENALVTGIYEHDGIRGVYKKAVYSEGMKKLYEMQDNLDELRRRGISVVQSKIENDQICNAIRRQACCIGCVKRNCKER